MLLFLVKPLMLFYKNIVRWIVLGNSDSCESRDVAFAIIDHIPCSIAVFSLDERIGCVSVHFRTSDAGRGVNGAPQWDV
jgi:hypothetical protein